MILLNKKKGVGIKMDNLISRQAVLDTIDSYMSHHMGLLDLKLFVTELPPVTPQPKVGHWIENAPEYQNIDPPYICSECGNLHLRKTNYCDQCGCRMVDPQESEKA